MVERTNLNCLVDNKEMPANQWFYEQIAKRLRVNLPGLVETRLTRPGRRHRLMHLYGWEAVDTTANVLRHRRADGYILVMGATADLPPDPVKLKVGDLYEDCLCEPLICIWIDEDEDEVTGISLVNGRVGSCSLTHCGVRRLTLAEAVAIRGAWPPEQVVEFAREHGQQLHMSGRTISGDVARAGQDGIPAARLSAIVSGLDGVPNP